VLTACVNSRVIDWNPDDYTVRSGDTIYSIAWKFELDPFELARWNRLDNPYIIHPGQRLHTRETEADASVAERDMSPAVITPVATLPESAPHATSHPTSHSTAHRKPASSTITVRDGDTLYSLARRHDISAGELARINKLKSPWLLKPGQTLSLNSRSTPKPKPKPAKRTPGAGRATVVAATPQAGRKPAAVVSGNRQVNWSWPVKGTVLTRFDQSRNNSKGIDIAGREGSTVRAAAPGKVVYSGNGLISYGNLVIIKHNRSYLSAYAYNRKLLVSEGDNVDAGQKIAELGRPGTDSPRLHFEIRKNGKPVNPLSYLPSS